MEKMLSVSVMAHPDRAEWFPYLRGCLGNDVPFAIDTGKGIWDTCLRAWLKHDPEAKYHVVIQDDAIICKNFKVRAEAFLKKFDAPNRAFSFYYGNKRNLRDIAKQSLKQGFAVRKRPGWGVALCLPTSRIQQMIEECDAMNNPQDDVRLGKYLFRHRMKIYYPMPSLIDHRTGTKSLVGDPGKHRQAWYYIDRYA